MSREIAKKKGDKDLEKLGHYYEEGKGWIIGTNIRVSKSWCFDNELCVELHEVRGELNAESLKLTTLKNFPVKVDSMTVIGNHITDFTTLKPGFECSELYATQCKLTSLKGLPERMNTLHFYLNPLTSLKHIPILDTDFILMRDNNNSKIEKIEFDAFYLKNKTGEKFDRDIDLLSYLVNHTKEKDFDKYNFPKGFATDNLINSLKGVNKFGL